MFPIISKEISNENEKFFRIYEGKHTNETQTQRKIGHGLNKKNLSLLYRDLKILFEHGSKTTHVNSCLV